MANKALVIGINHYEYLHPLQFAQQDAQSICDWLRQEANCTPDEVFLFCDDSPPIRGKSTRPTRNNLMRVLDQMFAKPQLGDGDNFWFFFSGHGKIYEDRDYLMLADSYPENISESAIAINYVTERLRRCGADNIILLLDACRNQGEKAGEGIGRQTEDKVREKGMISIFSCSPGEFFYEIEALQQGSFTYALKEGLRQSATVKRLDEHLLERVAQLNRQYQKGQQTPRTVVEPLSKANLILVPQNATPEDITNLKMEAYRAQAKHDFIQARRLWRRVLTATAGLDEEAIEALEIIARQQTGYFISSPVSIPVPTPDTEETGAEVSITSPTATPYQQEQPKEPEKPPSSSASKSPLIIPTQLFDFETATVSVNLVKVKVSKKGWFGREKIDEEIQNEIEIKRSRGQARGFVEDLGNGVLLEMVLIPAGNFDMGSPSNEEGRSERESPQHQVNVPSFFMGKYPVTQAQYERMMGTNPSNFKGSNRPVEQVSWFDAVEFCQKLSQQTGREYRLPSEAEWEYACRAGTTTPFYFGETITTELANYRGTDWEYGGTVYPGNYGQGIKGIYRQKTTPVGQFPPNAFGLYDMHGNVWEWCEDDWHGNYEGAPTDGRAWVDSNDNRSQECVLRGGSWYYNPRNCRSAYRVDYEPDRRYINLGFRVVAVART
jgi:formylglycine-generating enzyme required for sulfatase activity/uncharacterized caspase-like protein